MNRNGRRETRKLQKDFWRHPKLVFINIMSEFSCKLFSTWRNLCAWEKIYEMPNSLLSEIRDKIEKSLITYRKSSKSWNTTNRRNVIISLLYFISCKLIIIINHDCVMATLLLAWKCAWGILNGHTQNG